MIHTSQGQIIWPEVPTHQLELPSGPGPWTNAGEAPPYPDRASIWAAGPIQYRLVVGLAVLAGPYAHDPALGAPPLISVPSSTVLQVRNPAGAGLPIQVTVCRDIVTQRTTGVA